MKRALIGDTGFVGSNLLSQFIFDKTYNSKNIHEIEGQSFDEIICAGISAVKWLANKEPEKDWLKIKSLSQSLQNVFAKRFILISTIDVYKKFNGLTESDIPDVEDLHPYGRHRLEFENFISKNFNNYIIIRLPALFGVGLKKNALFDLISNNLTTSIIPNASYQWYPLRRLGSDLKIILDSNISLINITSEPILMETIRNKFFPLAVLSENVLNPPNYDIKTNYSSLLKGKNGYHLSVISVLSEIEFFLNTRN
jgi:hypothetical protein